MAEKCAAGDRSAPARTVEDLIARGDSTVGISTVRFEQRRLVALCWLQARP